MLSSAINNKDSIDTGMKHGNYSVKVHIEKYSTWNMKNTVSVCWYQKLTELHDGARPDSHVTAIWTNHIVENDIYFAPYRLET